MHLSSLLSFKIPPPRRLVAVNEALGNKIEVKELHFGNRDSELASFVDEANVIDSVGNTNVNSLKVKVNTLDNYINKHYDCKRKTIDLIKIDVEGFEFDVLLGAKGTIKKMRPKFIQIEYNWHHLFRSHSLHDISQLLPEYKIYQLLPYGNGFIERDPKRPESNIYHYANFIFVRNDISINT